MKNKMLIGFIIAVVVVGAGAFYGGMLYGKSQGNGGQNLTAAQRQQRFGQMGGGQGQGGQGRRVDGSFVNGSIIAKDDKSITVKSADGGSKIVFLAASTQITKSVDGSATDLMTGKNVIATGSTNSDGSLTAQSIQLRPDLPLNATSTPPTR